VTEKTSWAVPFKSEREVYIKRGNTNGRKKYVIILEPRKAFVRKSEKKKRRKGAAKNKVEKGQNHKPWKRGKRDDNFPNLKGGTLGVKTTRWWGRQKRKKEKKKLSRALKNGAIAGGEQVWKKITKKNKTPNQDLKNRGI